MKYVLTFILKIWSIISYLFQIIFTNSMSMLDIEGGKKILMIARATLKKPDKTLYYYALKHKFSQALRFICYNTILSSVILVYLFRFIEWPSAIETFLSIILIILAISILIIFRIANDAENSLVYYFENHYIKEYETIEKLFEENHIRDIVLFNDFLKSHETGEMFKNRIFHYTICLASSIIPLVAIIAVHNVPVIIKVIIGICFIALIMYDATSKLLNKDELEELDNMSFPPIKNNDSSRMDS